ncbi:MAG: hypothetical protein K6E98_11510 [Lachnospiraceae bacterium]|nr:hypothetical protein [Lachnospiraceae bacterium]
MIGNIGQGYSGRDILNGYSFLGSVNPQAVADMSGVLKTGGVEGAKPILNPGESTEVSPGRKVSPAECETCKERKYQDGSDEMVSFKSAAHISPEASAARVRAHEQEHVVNAYEEAAMKGGQVISCGVTLHTAICPECGRSYVSGGLTSTAIKYPNETNPYMKGLKSAHSMSLKGMNLDIAG